MDGHAYTVITCLNDVAGTEQLVASKRKTRRLLFVFFLEPGSGEKPRGMDIGGISGQVVGVSQETK